MLSYNKKKITPPSDTRYEVYIGFVKDTDRSLTSFATLLIPSTSHDKGIGLRLAVLEKRCSPLSKGADCHQCPGVVVHSGLTRGSSSEDLC